MKCRYGKKKRKRYINYFREEGPGTSKEISTLMRRNKPVYLKDRSTGIYQKLDGKGKNSIWY